MSEFASKINLIKPKEQIVYHEGGMLDFDCFIVSKMTDEEKEKRALLQ